MTEEELRNLNAAIEERVKSPRSQTFEMVIKSGGSILFAAYDLDDAKKLAPRMLVDPSILVTVRSARKPGEPDDTIPEAK